MEQAFSRYLAKAHSGFYSAQSPAQIKYTRSPPNIINRYRGARRSASFFLSILCFFLTSRSFLRPSSICSLSFVSSSFSLSPSSFLLPLFRPNRNSITSHLFYACVIVVRVSSSRRPRDGQQTATIKGEIGHAPN